MFFSVRCCWLLAAIATIEHALAAPHGLVEQNGHDHLDKKIRGSHVREQNINNRHGKNVYTPIETDFPKLDEIQPSSPASVSSSSSPKSPKSPGAYDVEKVARVVARKVYGKALMDRMPKKKKAQMMPKEFEPLGDHRNLGRTENEEFTPVYVSEPMNSDELRIPVY